MKKIILAVSMVMTLSGCVTLPYDERFVTHYPPNYRQMEYPQPYEYPYYPNVVTKVRIVTRENAYGKTVIEDRSLINRRPWIERRYYGW